MTGLRAAREAAYWTHWRKSLRDNPRDGLPAFLDRLEEIDRDRAVAQTVDGIIAGSIVLTAVQADQLRARLAAAVVSVPAAPAAAPPPDPEEPRPRRRTTRRAAS